MLTFVCFATDFLNSFVEHALSHINFPSFQLGISEIILHSLKSSHGIRPSRLVLVQQGKEQETPRWTDSHLTSAADRVCLARWGTRGHHLLQVLSSNNKDYEYSCEPLSGGCGDL